MSEASAADFIGVVDLRPQFRPPGDQGRRGTCVAFAVTSAHEHHHGGADGAEPDDLSEETLYWGCKQLDGVAGPGTRLSAADLALQRWGQPLEHLWPYDGDRDDAAADYSPPAAAIDPANCHRTALRRLAVDEATVLAELLAQRPVVVAMQVWEAFRRASTSPLPAPARDELYPTGHTGVLVGYDPTRAAVLFRNSWGTGWADDGHLWISVGIIPLLLGAWVVEPADDQGVSTTADDPVLTRGA